MGCATAPPPPESRDPPPLPPAHRPTLADLDHTWGRRMQEASHSLTTRQARNTSMPPAPVTPPAEAASRGGGAQPASAGLGPLSAAWVQRLQAALGRRLPPADVLQLDQGYLVVRRRPPGHHGTAASLRASAQPAAAPPAWDAAAEQRYQRQLRHLRLLAALRLTLHRRRLGAGGHPEHRFAAAVAVALGPAVWHAHQHGDATTMSTAH